MEAQMLQDAAFPDVGSNMLDAFSFAATIMPILNIVFLLGFVGLLVWFFRTFKANHEILKRIEEKVDRLIQR